MSFPLFFIFCRTGVLAAVLLAAGLTGPALAVQLAPQPCGLFATLAPVLDRPLLPLTAADYLRTPVPSEVVRAFNAVTDGVGGPKVKSIIYYRELNAQALAFLSAHTELTAAQKVRLYLEFGEMMRNSTNNGWKIHAIEYFSNGVIFSSSNGYFRSIISWDGSLYKVRMPTKQAADTSLLLKPGTAGAGEIDYSVGLLKKL